MSITCRQEELALAQSWPNTSEEAGLTPVDRRYLGGLVLHVLGGNGSRSRVFKARDMTKLAVNVVIAKQPGCLWPAAAEGFFPSSERSSRLALWPPGFWGRRGDWQGTGRSDQSRKARGAHNNQVSSTRLIEVHIVNWKVLKAERISWSCCNVRLSCGIKSGVKRDTVYSLSRIIWISGGEVRKKLWCSCFRNGELHWTAKGEHETEKFGAAGTEPLLHICRLEIGRKKH